MAKSYSATLQLKDANMVNTLKKASQAAKDLQKSLQAISKTPVTINAKLGSSFKNVEANINRITPKSKTIKIEATENVTKTMNQVNRQMFEMSNKMNSTINTSMKGFTSRLTASLPKLQAMSNTMAAIANTSRLISAASGASVLAGAGAGIAGAAALKGTRITQDDDTKVKGISQPKSKKATAFEAFVGGWRDTMKKAKGIYEDALDEMMDGSKDAFYSSESYFGKMIERQKAKLKELGEVDPLKHYQSLQIPVSFDIDEDGQMDAIFESGYQKVPNKFVRAYRTATESIKNLFSRCFSTVGNYISTKLSKPISWMQTQFNKVSTWTSNVFNKCWTAIQRTGLKAAYAVERGFYHVGSGAYKVYSKIVSTFNNIGTKIASFIPEPIRRAFNKTDDASKKAARQSFRAFADMAVKAGNSITNKIGSAFSGLVNKAKTAATAISAAFGAAFGVGVKDMANQEEYITSMTHFISVDDAKANGTNTITMDQAKERAEGLFEWGTDFANKTPFGNAEVYSAINRMTQVFGYGEDGSDVQKMVKLVGDMAALNPGKTMSDAAEAIADLAMGETERMKEFGLKLTQDDLKALAGVPDQSDSLSQDQIMKAFSELSGPGGQLFETFDGGADALSSTLSGKWSTLTGQFRQMMVESIEPVKEEMKGALDKVIGHISGPWGNKFKSTLSNVFKGISDVMSGNKESDIPMVSNILNAFNRLKEAVTPIIDNIKSKFGETGISFETVGKLIENAAGGIATAIEFLTPVFNALVNVGAWLVNAFAEHPALFKTIAVAIAGLAVLGPIISLVTGAIKVFNTIKTVIDGVKAAFTILNVLGLGPIAIAIAAVVAVGVLLWQNWDWICQKASELWGWIKDLWAQFKETPIGEFVDGALQGLIGGFKELVGWLKDGVEWFGSLIDKAKEWGSSKIQGAKDWWNEKFSKDEDGSNAYGLDRVPFDGYKAVLHEGERVLTAREAREIDRGTGSSVSNSTTVNVNGAQDARSVANEVVRELKAIIPNMA